MKRSFHWLGAILFLMGLYSCNQFIKTKILPYSMVQYQPQKFIDETEITVEQWAEFVFDGNESYKPNEETIKPYKHYELFYPSTEPDSLFRAFGKIDYYELPVIKTYFDTLSYGELRTILDFPITGIHFKDVQAYCKWRTKKYNEVHTTFTDKFIEFQLPDSVVLKPIVTLYKVNKHNRKEPITNLEGVEYEKQRDAPHKIVAKTVGQTPVKTKSFPPNKYGVYDLIGNVAEMTSTPHLAYGGSYKTSKTELHHIPYEDVEPWLGFRCVGLVKEQ